LRTRTWRQKSFDRRIVESIALDSLEAGGSGKKSARLLKISAAKAGSSKKTPYLKARTLTGWRRMRALVALGQTRALEGNLGDGGRIA